MKPVKGREYCYFQSSEPGGVARQMYIGPRSPVIDSFVERYTSDRQSAREEVDTINRLCSQLRIGGATTTDPETARVLKALSDSGFFKVGGVLVGTHAFLIMGNTLGVKWEKPSLRTQDIDIAGSLHMEVAVPELSTDIPGVLESLQMGFLPIPPLNHKHPSTSFHIRGKELRVDVLTPAKRPNQVAPIYITRLKTAAQPLMYLDFLIESQVQAAVINGGGILASIPDPARFALHKLLVSGERPVSSSIKATKDLFQAAQLIQVLAEDRPGDLPAAFESLRSRGKRWTRRVETGLKLLSSTYPDTYALFRSSCPDTQ
ncbi:MAG: GSU2403 family nucleotidyltransferase fold protein [Desulfomonilia bacterium]|nr:GSU2403 family nucleotidyltransferase fold protein [Desulfomonilia bacterium]